MGDLPPGVFRVCGKYRLRKRIGSGSFGEVYSGNNVITGEGVAVKMEPLDTDHPKLHHEWTVYKSLGPAAGIPRIFWSGAERGYRAIIMSLLGPSLEDLFDACNHKFTLKTVLMLADQLISLVEYIHAHHYVHRDIKPDNLLMGMHQDCHKVNIIDFGLANKYRNEDTLNHIPYHTYKSLTGTARYASVNSHLGIEQTRRDDLESLAYVLIYFLRGSLPWQHLEGSAKKQKYQRVKQRKLKTSTLELCSGIPNEFHTFLCYARDLRFNAEPNYDYIRKLFKKLFTAKGYRYDHNYDWSQKCVGIPVPNSGFSADLASKLRPRKGSCDSGAGGSAGH